RLLRAPCLVPRTLRLDALQLGHARGCRGLGEPPRQQEVPRVAAGDGDHVPAQPELLDVLEEDDVHLLRDVREQRHLPRALHGSRDLELVPPAGARDAARADLALLRDVAPELGRVLVVDLVHLVAAEVAALAPATGRGRPLPPAWGRARLLARHRLSSKGT